MFIKWGDRIKVDAYALIKAFFLERENTAYEALNIFSQTSFCSLPVIDEAGVYLGIIKLHKIIGSKVNESHKIASMIEEYPPINEQEDLPEVSSLRDNDIIPIINDSGLLMGFLSKETVLSTTCKQHKKLANQFSKVINSLYNGIVAINAEGIIIAFNPAAERILGHNKGDVLGRHISYVDPAMGLLETLEKERTSIGVKTVINGFTILSNRTPLMEGENCVGAIGVFVDISDFEKVSYELNINKAIAKELNTIFEASYDGFYIVDKVGRVVRVNSAWEKICGFSREYVVGKTANELVSEGCYDNSAALLTLEKKETSTVMLEMTSGPKKGQKIIATGTPIMDDDGQLKQVVVNVRDITALESLKKQLNETKELSERYANELAEIRLQQHKFDDMVAQSPAMQKVLELAIRVSKVDSTVIITGESGVGKEVIAKKIHNLSKRKDNSLIKINCGAIPENLLESELFGYEGGAFTGAKKDGKPGMFELASGGTLFLDEIGDLPLNLQVKLLRVLQEKEIIRVGGVKPIKVDTRIIAATNKDLGQMVRKGIFREDLFYRLNVVNIKIPPLRNRPEDLPPLINIILKNLNEKYSKNKKLSSEVVQKLLNYNWPGNIRELENTLERLIVLINENIIHSEHLPEFLQNGCEDTASIVTLNGIIPLKKAIEEMENQLLKRALKEHGTTRKVAKVLGVNQSTVVRKIKQYSIEKSDVDEHQEDAYLHQLRI